MATLCRFFLLCFTLSQLHANYTHTQSKVCADTDRSTHIDTKGRDAYFNTPFTPIRPNTIPTSQTLNTFDLSHIQNTPKNRPSPPTEIPQIQTVIGDETIHNSCGLGTFLPTGGGTDDYRYLRTGQPKKNHDYRHKIAV